MDTRQQEHWDLVLVGGGLQSCLAALALLCVRPSARVCLVERADRLGGNHTWCFHEGDLTPNAKRWVSPLVAHRWPGYTVHFPRRERRLASSYSAVTSERLHRVTADAFARAPNGKLELGTSVERIEPGRVTLATGAALHASAVLDARGPDRFASRGHAAYQKFVGLELELAEDAPWREPVLMDARVPQVDGYRFFYVLPLTSRRVLVEDTYFSDTPHLDRAGLRQEILAYAQRQGASVRSVMREEEGVLPLPLGMDGAPRDWPGATPLASAQAAPLLPAGYQGGWFHPTTGYSFPVALRLAEAIAAHVGTTDLISRLNDLAHAQRQQYRFAVFLNQLLYFGFPVPERVNVFERFYGLPADTISRFYALSMTATDQARILVGWPPRGMSLRHAWSRLSQLSRRPEQHTPADSIL